MEALNLLDSVDFQKHVLSGVECKQLMPSANRPAWVYNYYQPDEKWLLSIATYGEPGSNSFSLGGFRIAPEARSTTPGYSNAREALELATGMEEKVYWSRLIRVGGPIGIKNLDRIVGGKNVMLPTNDSRVGKVRDIKALDFALSCFKDFEQSSGVNLITGQDLGHGLLSDGKTDSLKYINERFKASVVSDTSKPTAEGNFYFVKGCLKALKIELDQAVIGLIGCGNIGLHLARRFKEHNATVIALENSEARREELKALGIKCFLPSEKKHFLSQAMDTLIVNANAGSLDRETLELVANNDRVRFVTGCENLAVPDLSALKLIEAKGKFYGPTELCGMMGYLTAVEEYLSYLQKTPYQIESMFEASKKLEEAGREVTAYLAKSNFDRSFEQAVKAVYER
jgi:hypothetical protein